ncbi:tyrosine-type recombinase/integrase [Maritimibacter fusiformis]|uniref:Site-specific integrase n=1 Tax=Maritimibacter fusiformis TaxID=2603819 RepID=A0A5D0RIR5_9RHOB|nr:site-specific integrase [Maritimibacter fusiformis]TYB80989.1 site-specific integrase [Maritimibacter fusiformis]
MATIRKLPSGKWNVQVRSKGKLYASKTFVHRRRAEKWAKEKDAELGVGHLLFIDAGHKYCIEVLDGKPSQLLAANRVDRISRYPAMDKPMDKITLQDINAYKKYRLAEVSKATCRDELLMIRRVYRWYIREHHAETGKLLSNPSEYLTVPPPGKARERVISRRELHLLLGAMSPQMAKIVEFAFETAMRRSEILKFTPNDVFLDDRFLRVIEGKEGSRDVPLTKRAVELLEGVAHAEGQDLPVFNAAPYSVTQALRRARIKAGLGEDVKFHQLRHSRITEVARMGLNQAQIMVVSGHRDIRSVQRYTHLNVRDVVGLIDQRSER